MFDELKELICQYVEVEPEDIKEDSRFIEDLCFNSYDFVNLLGELEEKYEVTINEEDVLELHTVAQAIAYIENLRG